MTSQTIRPATTMWATEIETFLADESLTRNPRSVTAVRNVDGKSFHFKHARDSLAAEARAFELAAMAGDVGGVRSVVLTVFDPRANVLITERARGESLFNAVWNDSSRFPRARPKRDWTAVLGRSAAWLAAFHRASANSPACLEAPVASCLERLQALFDSKISVITNSPTAPLTRAEIDRIHGVVERDLHPDLWREEPIRCLHGDYALANQLILEDASIRVLDFGDSAVGFALEDLVRLWSGVWEVAQCGRLRRRALGAALVSILADYSLPPRTTTSGPFRLLRIYNALIQASVACTSRSSYDLSTTWIHRRLTRNQLHWLRREVLEPSAS